MINTARVLKVTAVWISIVYVVCYVGVLLFPGIRDLTLYYALHMTGSSLRDAFTITNFITGLIIWNIVAFLGVGLFARLYNRTNQ